MAGTQSATEKVAARLAGARSPWVALTGAGMSTESGLPDFRSGSDRKVVVSTVPYSQFCSDPDARWAFWQQKSALHDAYVSAIPHRGHSLLARWEQEQRLLGVITQNIDGLHQKAGSSVLELHGNMHQVCCLECEFQDAASEWVEQFRQTNTVPDCPHCGAPLKHATISFGQNLSPSVLQKAWCWSKQASGMIVIGTSLTVSPAAELPRVAKQAGAELIIINREPTPLDDLADIVIQAEAGATLARIQDALARAQP